MSDVIAFYGGTFSPPHIGHIHAARMFAEAIQPKKLLIIPSSIPPHKQIVNGADDQDRLEMCRLAFADISGAEVSDIEFHREGKSYTADTIAQLHEDYDRVAMLIGTDMLLTLDTWYHPAYIFSHAELYCFRRENDPEITSAIEMKNEEYFRKYHKRVIVLPGEAISVSSTQIRDALKSGDTSELLTPAVAAYIKERGLYQ